MPDKLRYNRKSGGYLLVESMIGISIAVVGLLGILTLLSRSVGLSRVVGNQLTANYLAVEGVEISKNIIDTNVIQGNPWNQGFDMDGKFGPIILPRIWNQAKTENFYLTNRPIFTVTEAGENRLL